MLPRLFRGFFTQCALNKGVFIEVGDFGCYGLLMTPGAGVENPWTMLRAGILSALWTVGSGVFMVRLSCTYLYLSSLEHVANQFSSQRALFEYAPATERMMEQLFTKEEMKKHWYVFIMGTSVDRQRQGLASALLLDMQERARVDGRPLWLEATTEPSLALYLKYGFQNHGEIILGKGKVGRDGLPMKSGEGIVIWSMSWRP